MAAALHPPAYHRGRNSRAGHRAAGRLTRAAGGAPAAGNFAPRANHNYRARLCPPDAHGPYSKLGGPPGSGCRLASRTSRIGKVFGGLGALLVALIATGG